MTELIDVRKLRTSRAAKSAGDGNGSGEEKTSWLNKEIFAGKKVSIRFKADLYKELASLIDAGVDIRVALSIIEEGQKKDLHKRVINGLLQKIVSGSALSIAMKREGYFSKYEYYTIEIGEESGRLAVVLAELGKYYEHLIGQKRQVVGALSYPAVVLSVAFCAIYFMLTFVVPMFSDVFKRFGNELPALTRFVLEMAAFFRRYIYLIVIAIVILLLICLRSRQKIWFRKLSSKLLLRMPYLGDIVLKVYLARFSNTMSMLLQAKVPILDAIQMCKQIIRFYPIECSLSEVETDILEGASLYQSMAKHSIFPSKMNAMIKVGEEVSQLDSFFSNIGQRYIADVEFATSVLSKMIEPLIIVVLGLIVGLILIAMYLPLFQMGQGV